MIKKITAACLVILGLMTTSCEREPMLHLHQGGTDINMDLPEVILDLHVLWDYLFSYDHEYDWKAEWLYGWDEKDVELFGTLEYTLPTDFNVRRYYTKDVQYGQHTAPYRNYVVGTTLSAKYDFGYWDILAWSEIHTSDGIQSIRIDETSTYDYVTAHTGQTMTPSRYNAPRFTRAFYQPEALFSGYKPGIEINKNLEGFVFDEERNVWVKHLDMVLQPVTYIYLPLLLSGKTPKSIKILPEAP